MDINLNNYEAFFLDYHEGTLSGEGVAALFLFLEEHPELKDEFESFEHVSLEDFDSIDFGDKTSLKKEITDDNKEDFYIAYTEGILNGPDAEFFENYIAENKNAVNELSLYQKTKVSPDYTLNFSNSGLLKKPSLTLAGSIKLPVVSFDDDALISATEGLIPERDRIILEQELAAKPDLNNDYQLYKRSKLSVDNAVFFENKESLKRKAGRVVSFYYAFAAAASVLLIIGLFFLNGNKGIEENNMLSASKTNVLTPSFNNQNTLSTNTSKDEVATSASAANSTAIHYNRSGKGETQEHTSEKSVVKEVYTNAENNIDTQIAIVKNDTLNQLPIAVLPEHKNFAIDTLVKPELIMVDVNKGSNTKQYVKIERAESDNYIGLRELAAEKLKETLLDKNSVEAQRKTGRLKKISGWDIAQIVVRGVGKISGRSMDVTPTYDDEGNVTAYAMAAGDFRFSKKMQKSN